MGLNLKITNDCKTIISKIRNAQGATSGTLNITNGSASYTGITTTGSGSQVTIFPSQNLGSREMYFYQSKGLINDSLGAFWKLATTVLILLPSNVICVLPS